jgi:hypothetical protein
MLAAGCFTPDLGEGQVLCGVDGSCPPHYRCAGDGRCYSDDVDAGNFDLAGCVVTSCGPQACGVISDGCGSTIDCGDSCAMGTSCGGGGTPHVCGCPTEVACGNRNCGTMPDGCGGVATCGGACPSGESCGGGGGGMRAPNVCSGGMACTPKVCQLNKDCGLISDGCSAVLDCGVCQTGKTCGADHLCH